MKTLLLIDGNNTAIRNLSVNKFLSYGDEWTGGLYGSISEIVTYMNENVQPSGVVFCTDTKPYLRDKDYPNYKGDRKKKEYDEKDAPAGWDWYDALADAKRQLEEFCEVAGYPYWSLLGYEADDLIALCVEKFVEDYDEIHILSNDTDLNQLFVHDNVRIWKKIGKGKQLYSPKDFVEQFQFEPEWWCFYTALVGTHNGVPGIKGIGAKTALKIIQSPDKTEEIIDKYEKELGEKLNLIELPYWRSEETSIAYPDPETPKNRFRKIMLYLEAKGVEVTNRFREAFE